MKPHGGYVIKHTVFFRQAVAKAHGHHGHRGHARQLLQLLDMESPRELMRQKEDLYKSLNLADPALSDAALIQAMVANPKLIERPMVVSRGQARIGRPPEQVLEIVS